MWNLLTNAIKITPEGGRVSFPMKHDARRIRIIVSDRGRASTAGTVQRTGEYFAPTSNTPGTIRPVDNSLVVFAQYRPRFVATVLLGSYAAKCHVPP
jgi:hypothetical protein